MKTTPRQHGSCPPSGELAKLRARLAEAEATLHAIRRGEVDAVVVAGKEGSRVFTLEGAEHAYRVLIESMNEGALTLTVDKTILYANQCFARMVKCPLEQVMGRSFDRFLSVKDRAALRALMKRSDKSDSKFQVLLIARDGSQKPVQISVRKLAKNGFQRATFGIVITDMTEVRRNEEMLRASHERTRKILQTVTRNEEMLQILSRRLLQAQEVERGRVALELHDHITQLLCAILVRSQTLANKLSAREGPAKREAIKLREMLGQTAEEVARISRKLRPSVLDELGLVAVLQDTTREFTERTGVSLKLACVKMTVRLPADAELTLYRILQEALNNVEKHAGARHVRVRLMQRGGFVHLAIKDDGLGFDADHHSAKPKGKGGLGLLSMRERAGYVGGALTVKSLRGAGTEINVRIPLATNLRGRRQPAEAG